MNISNPFSKFDKNIAFFRVDSSADIGGGHLFRCLNLAQQLHHNNFDIVFICKNLAGNQNDKITALGYELRCLNEDENQPFDPDIDAKATASLIEQYHGSNVGRLLLTDHYQINGDWYRYIIPMVNLTIAIDDLANRTLPVDIVVNTGLSTTHHDYVPWTNPDTTLLLGSKYTMLNSSFAKYRTTVEEKSNPDINNILIFFGTSDPKEHVLLTLAALQMWPEYHNYHWTILLSEQAKHFNKVSSAVLQDFPDIKLSKFEADMAEFLSQFDLVIGANGINSFERCVLGIPAITLNAADNQQENAQTLSKLNAILVVDEQPEALEKAMINAIEKIIHTPKLYQQMQQSALKVCDHLGIERIIKSILSMRLRAKLISATQQQLNILYDWQTSPQTRQFSRNPKPPTIEEHTQWYNALLKDSNRQLYFVEQANTLVAMVRIDFNQHTKNYENEISIIVSPSARNQGIGQLALQLIRQRYNHLSLSAYIQNEHKRSIKLFEQCGYKNVANCWYINPRKDTHEQDNH
ncbi:UDP-2,4-diacetamido-2,4,6-trideoxy-beta-L-altropyranose hydrolase [Colwelliaceae bacterium 6471]